MTGGDPGIDCVVPAWFAWEGVDKGNAAVVTVVTVVAVVADIAMFHLIQHEDAEQKCCCIKTKGQGCLLVPATSTIASCAVLRYAPCGSYIVTSSVAWLTGNGQLMDYFASKGAIHALTMSWAKNLAGQGIRVNAVAPGRYGRRSTLCRPAI